MQLTQDGQLVWQRCQDLLADFDELQALFQQGPAELTGRLRVDMPLGVARHVVMPALPAFLQDATRSWRWSSAAPTAAWTWCARDSTACCGSGQLGESSLVARPLGHYQMANVASAGYVAAHGRPESLADLARHRMVHLPTGPGFPITRLRIPG